jgi:hypothetical protein
MPAISATLEADIGRLLVQGQPRQKKLVRSYVKNNKQKGLEV